MNGFGSQQGGGNGGPLQQSLMGLTNVLAAIAAMIGAPLIYEFTIPFFLELAARTYGRDMLALMDVVWFALMFPATFFCARAAFFVALTSAATFAALRFA